MSILIGPFTYQRILKLKRVWIGIVGQWVEMAFEGAMIILFGK